MNEAIALANMVQRFEEKGITKLFPRKPSLISKIFSRITGKKPKSDKISDSIVSDSENIKIEKEESATPQTTPMATAAGTIVIESPSSETAPEGDKLLSSNDLVKKSSYGLTVNNAGSSDEGSMSEDEIESALAAQKPIAAVDKIKEVDFMTENTKKFIGATQQKHVLKYYSNPFSIQTRNEMGKLTEMFLGPIGKFIFYLVVVIYLFGDLRLSKLISFFDAFFFNIKKIFFFEITKK